MPLEPLPLLTDHSVPPVLTTANSHYYDRRPIWFLLHLRVAAYRFMCPTRCVTNRWECRHLASRDWKILCMIVRHFVW